MEIGPIPGIRNLPVLKSPKNDPQLSVFDIESACGPQEDTFSPGNGELAGGQDGEPGETDAQPEPAGESNDDDSGATVNLFA